MTGTLREARERAGLSLAVLARMAGIGKSTLGNYEIGATRLSAQKLTRIAECLKTSPENLRPLREEIVPDVRRLQSTARERLQLCLMYRKPEEIARALHQADAAGVDELLHRRAPGVAEEHLINLLLVEIGLVRAADLPPSPVAIAGAPTPMLREAPALPYFSDRCLKDAHAQATRAADWNAAAVLAGELARRKAAEKETEE
jgi:transcriptional regulator with XRE-family HTH domain